MKLDAVVFELKSRNALPAAVKREKPAFEAQRSAVALNPPRQRLDESAPKTLDWREKAHALAAGQNELGERRRRQTCRGRLRRAVQRGDAHGPPKPLHRRPAFRRQACDGRRLRGGTKPSQSPVIRNLQTRSRVVRGRAATRAHGRGWAAAASAHRSKSRRRRRRGPPPARHSPRAPTELDQRQRGRPARKQRHIADVDLEFRGSRRRRSVAFPQPAASPRARRPRIAGSRRAPAPPTDPPRPPRRCGQRLVSCPAYVWPAASGAQIESLLKLRRFRDKEKPRTTRRA